MPEYKRTPPSEGKLLYHITHIDNMPSILKYGLLSRRQMTAQGLKFTDIADQEILAKREERDDPLSAYVPFHFYVKNPFDGAVCRKYGSKNMVIIAIQRSLHESNNFYVVPMHPLSQDTPKIYNYAEGIQKVDWKVLDNYQDRDYHNDVIRSKCMAECLVPTAILPQAFWRVFVYDREAEAKILKMAGSKAISKSLDVNANMFPNL